MEVPKALEVTQTSPATAGGQPQRSGSEHFRTGPDSRPVGGSKIPHTLSQDSIQILSDASPVAPMTGLARDFPARPRLSGTPQVFGSQLLTLLGVYAWMAQG